MHRNGSGFSRGTFGIIQFAGAEVNRNNFTMEEPHCSCYPLIVLQQWRSVVARHAASNDTARAANNDPIEPRCANQPIQLEHNESSNNNARHKLLQLFMKAFCSSIARRTFASTLAGCGCLGGWNGIRSKVLCAAFLYILETWLDYGHVVNRRRFNI